MAHKILKFRITGKVNKMILYRGKGGKACGKKNYQGKREEPSKSSEGVSVGAQCNSTQ